MPFSRFGRIEWSVVTLGAFSLFAMWATDRAFRDSYNWVRHTIEVRRQLTVLERELFRTESGQRGFLITGREDYLEDYRRGLAQTPVVLNRLIETTADNPRQQKRLCEIRDDLDTKLRTLSQTIELVKWGEKSRAFEIISRGEGRRAMINILGSLDECIAEEDRLLVGRDSRYLWLGRAFATVFALCGAMTLTAVILGVRKYRYG